MFLTFITALAPREGFTAACGWVPTVPAFTDVASSVVPPAPPYRPKLFASPAAAAVWRVAVHDSRKVPVARVCVAITVSPAGVAPVAVPGVVVTGPAAE